MPKKGRHFQVGKVREGNEAFGKARKWHAGFKPAIHTLGAGNGLNLYRDKALYGYRHMAMGVLGWNFQTIRTYFIKKERKWKPEQIFIEFLI